MKDKKAAKKLSLYKETLKELSKRQLNEVVGGSDNGDCYCPGDSNPNSCIAYCGI